MSRVRLFSLFRLSRRTLKMLALLTQWNTEHWEERLTDCSYRHKMTTREDSYQATQAHTYKTLYGLWNKDPIVTSNTRYLEIHDRTQSYVTSLKILPKHCRCIIAVSHSKCYIPSVSFQVSHSKCYMHLKCHIPFTSPTIQVHLSTRKDRVELCMQAPSYTLHILSCYRSTYRSMHSQKCYFFPALSPLLQLNVMQREGYLLPT